jgi:hypothetical protein
VYLLLGLFFILTSCTVPCAAAIIPPLAHPQLSAGIEAPVARALDGASVVSVVPINPVVVSATYAETETPPSLSSPASIAYLAADSSSESGSASSYTYHEPPSLTLTILLAFLLLLPLSGNLAQRTLGAALLGQILLGVIFGTPVGGWLEGAWEEAFVALGYVGLLGLVFEGMLSLLSSSCKGRGQYEWDDREFRCRRDKRGRIWLGRNYRGMGTCKGGVIQNKFEP